MLSECKVQRCASKELCSLCFSLHTSFSELSRGRILLYSN